MSKYEPWNEPKKIKKELYPFLKELNENYPDGKIYASDWDGDRFNEDLGYFTDLLEYEKPTALLRDYGFHILKGSQQKETAEDGYDREPDDSEYSESEPEEGKKSGKKLIGILITLFLLAAAAFAAYYFLLPMLSPGGDSAPLNPLSDVSSGFTESVAAPAVPTARPEQNISVENLPATPTPATQKPSESPAVEESSKTAGLPVPAAPEANQQAGGLPVTVTSEAGQQTGGLPVSAASEAGQSSASKKIALQYGDVGEEVGKLQLLLSSKGFLSGGIDGEYGSMTREAVKSFQKANGFEATGNITEEELALLKGETAKQGN